MNAIRGDLAAAFGLLTRLPTGWLVPKGLPYRPARAVWAYPLAGALVGALAGVAGRAGQHAGLAPWPVALLALGAALLLTGGLHEDGLADTADGFGGGRDPARRLEIMRDSRIGSYGALALIVVLGLRASALSVLAWRPDSFSLSLIAAGAVSRAAMLLALVATGPARRDGLAAPLADPPRLALAAGLGLGLLGAWWLMPPLRAFVAVLLAAACALGMAAFAQRRIGGHTGDVLGAVACLSETLVLLVACAGGGPV